MTVGLARELLSGTWFLLSLTIFLMFAYISWAACVREGYRSVVTKASLALTVFFLGLGLSQGWVWAQAWLPRHGFAEFQWWIMQHTWWPIMTGLIGMAGAVCLIRVFFPACFYVGKTDRELSWIIPVLVVIILKFGLALV